MTSNLLTILAFVIAFAGVVLAHEFGHYIVSLLFKIEVEEFGIGIPPRAFRFWRNKGYFFLDNGKRVEIPRNFHMTLDWQKTLNQPVTINADTVDDKLVLRFLKFQEVEEEDDDQENKSKSETKKKPKAPPKIIEVGTRVGTEITGTVKELHAGTDFTINWIPFGGFVRPRGENDPTVPGGLASARPFARFSVLSAGAIMNLIAGTVIFTFLFTQIGIPDFTRIQISDVVANSPAAQAGIQADDIIVEANGEAITDTAQLHDLIYSHLDQPVVFTIQRGQEFIELTGVPSSARSADEGALGIRMGPTYVQPKNIFAAIPYGAMATYGQARMLLSLPAQILRGTISAEESRFIGLKGMYDIFENAVSRDVESRRTAVTPASTETTRQKPSFYTLQLIAILNVSIGLFNLLPFPALDGGRIFFIIPELVLRRRVPAQFENLVHAVGIIALLLFMAYVNIMDFVNPIQIPGP